MGKKAWAKNYPYRVERGFPILVRTLGGFLMHISRAKVYRLDPDDRRIVGEVPREATDCGRALYHTDSVPRDSTLTGLLNRGFQMCERCGSPGDFRLALADWQAHLQAVSMGRDLRDADYYASDREKRCQRELHQSLSRLDAMILQGVAELGAVVSITWPDELVDGWRAGLGNDMSYVKNNGLFLQFSDWLALWEDDDGP